MEKVLNMLKVEYLKEGSSDCPLIRISGKDIDTYKLLYDQISLLISHRIETIHVQALKGFELINIDGLDLYVDKENKGIIRINDRLFECRLKIDDSQGWLLVMGLLEPFCTQKLEQRFQWLVDCSEIKLLISTDGHW